MKNKTIDTMVVWICIAILGITILNLWITNQRSIMRYNKCIEVVRLYKNYNNL